MKLHRRAAPIVSAIALAIAAVPAVQAQTTAVALGMSGWTGFAPLTLADKAGIFKKHGVDVDIKMIPQKDRHLALASGAIQCAATTVETHVAWNANGVPITQIVQLDKSYGADGLAVRGDVKTFADLKGKTIGVDAPGTAPFFGLAWMLRKNGMTLKDVKLTTLSPQAAAQAFVAGQNDGAMTYEPYLSTVRANPDKGKILATTLDYPMVTDTLGCAPKWLKDNPKAAQGLVDSYFEALEMIRKEPEKSNEIMGAAVKQTGEQFAKSSAYLRWQDKEANRKFFAGELASFSKEAADVLKDIGVIRQVPDVTAIYDARFLK
ncbi:ABC transporter substrate-binding protein [Cupriavidus pauculus]|uniref:ABC transporter substrate-binding protein n=1 Tax=Cupriavidus pauculus TaxID=82633 RepID=UPI00124769BC|nr:ABC transporter substrate-binding protein [Cupriavidus pauculus]KAB0604305.1 ABC transporter substrate-binding protein [Cupriavidus pauculus]MCM3606567.1 ABC transporter substrate-binding protein [Cupriavidus pauculus]UAL00652.1 ABC transporter substrate-binding protein [Cupriavidus pauculus]